MERLNERQKQVLRFLVKAVRAKDIKEEFNVQFIHSGPVTFSCEGGPVDLPDVTPLTLDLLTEEGLVFSRTQIDSHGGPRYTCYITPDGFRAVDNDFAPVQDIAMHRPPVEITESLARFRSDFPDPTRLAFVMMQFGSSPAHQGLVQGIRGALDHHGMIALRADDKQYHEDVYYNILTYIHGCRFGIAVFERIDANTFNPNVSLEIGYMKGLNKSVCLLKDKTLLVLHTDLVGKLYREFDTQDPYNTIPPVLYAWMDEQGFIVRR